jgi:hypothetical protein
MAERDIAQLYAATFAALRDDPATAVAVIEKLVRTNDDFFDAVVAFYVDSVATDLANQPDEEDQK